MSDDKRATNRPATFAEVFASSEYRGVFLASALSWIGDYLAKAAVTALVYRETHSTLLSAAAFAISYLPWVVGGPVLAAVAERHPPRSVMVISDVIRAVLICLVAIPGMHTIWMIVLLFATALFNPPFQAARSALLPRILHGDQYVVGMSVQITTGQAAQILGYIGGAALATFHPRLALLLDGGTFVISALVIQFRVRDHAAGLAVAQRSNLLRETAAGFTMVFGSPVLRGIAIVSLAALAFPVVPEGLAAAWAYHLVRDESERGWAQGLIMMGPAIGTIVGGLLVSRLVAPATRRRLVPAFAVITPLALVPALIGPSVIMVAVLGGLSSFAIAGLMPTANGMFVQALPVNYRARAFGVMQSGVQIVQGIAVVSTGLLADQFSLPTVVGVWSLAGVALMAIACAWWPTPPAFQHAVDIVAHAPVAQTADIAAHAPVAQTSDAQAPPAHTPPTASVPTQPPTVDLSTATGKIGT